MEMPPLECVSGDLGEGILNAVRWNKEEVTVMRERELRLAEFNLKESKGFGIEKGQKVFSASHGSFYKATVLRRDVFNGNFYFFVHYDGWPDSYDDWVEKERLFLDKPEGEDTEYTSSLSIILPASLHTLVLQDFEAMTGENKVLPLPRPKSVQDILEAFLKANPGQDHFVTMVYLFFHRVLPMNLLYPIEQPQFDEIVRLYGNASLALSKVYGVEHLLRFIIQIPSLLVDCDSKPEDVVQFKNQLDKLIEFIDRTAL